MIGNQYNLNNRIWTVVEVYCKKCIPKMVVLSCDGELQRKYVEELKGCEVEDES